jgi:hypothetical protein
MEKIDLNAYCVIEANTVEAPEIEEGGCFYTAFLIGVIVGTAVSLILLFS